MAAHPGNVEALRYLVALCQQSGRAADAQRYGHLLRRAEVNRHAGAGFATAENAPALCESIFLCMLILERISQTLPCNCRLARTTTTQATEAAAAAAAAEQAQHPGGGQQPRSGTGSDPGQAQSAAAQAVINLDSHLAAKAGRPTGGLPAGRKAAGGDDDWGEEPLGDDLLPM